MKPEPPISRTVERIVLTGFMGAGKSTIGPILADRLGWRFFDADHELQSQTGTTIADIFTSLGEPAFRRMEAEVVAQLLARHEAILALGGGAVEAEDTRFLLATSANTCVVYLQAPLEILIDRCEQQTDAAVRPVLREREALRQRFHSRLPHYKSAHIIVPTEGFSPGIVADNVLRIMLEAAFAVPLSQKAMTT
jgi:shikimate kinase